MREKTKCQGQHKTKVITLIVLWWSNSKSNQKYLVLLMEEICSYKGSDNSGNDKHNISNKDSNSNMEVIQK